MKNIEIFDLTILGKDIKSKKIKLVSDKELYEKFKLYIGAAMNNNYNYDYICCGYKCLYLLEKHYPNSPYIFKTYQSIKIGKFLYDKIKRSA